ncbi:hypothetical protein [Geobacillus subterraneus]|uniref:hypothetical protein n=1 Tax=Geobacillus subterraneus TaxID=129338 RepID=UPI001619D5D1
MQFEALTFAAFTEHWIDCRAIEQRRFQTHVWVCEASDCSVFQATGLLSTVEKWLSDFSAKDMLNGFVASILKTPL